MLSRSRQKSMDSAYMVQNRSSFHNKKSSSVVGNSRTTRNSRYLLVGSPTPGVGRRTGRPLGVKFEKQKDGLDAVNGYFPESDEESLISTVEDDVQMEEGIEMETQQAVDSDSQQAVDSESQQEIESEGQQEDLARSTRGGDFLVNEEELMEKVREGDVIDSYFNREVFGMQTEENSDAEENSNDMQDDMESQVNHESQVNRESQADHESQVNHESQINHESQQMQSPVCNRSRLNDDQQQNHTSFKHVAVSTDINRLTSKTLNATVGTNTSAIRFTPNDSSPGSARQKDRYVVARRGGDFARKKSLAGRKRSNKPVEDHAYDDDYEIRDRIGVKRHSQYRREPEPATYSETSSDEEDKERDFREMRFTTRQRQAVQQHKADRYLRTSDKNAKRMKILQTKSHRKPTTQPLRTKRLAASEKNAARQVKESSHRRTLNGAKNERRRLPIDEESPVSDEAELRPGPRSGILSHAKRQAAVESIRRKAPENLMARSELVMEEVSESDSELMGDERYDRLKSVRVVSPGQSVLSPRKSLRQAEMHIAEPEESLCYDELGRDENEAPDLRRRSQKRPRKSVQFVVSTPANDDVTYHGSPLPGITPVVRHSHENETRSAQRGQATSATKRSNSRLSLTHSSAASQEVENDPKKDVVSPARRKKKRSSLNYHAQKARKSPTNTGAKNERRQLPIDEEAALESDEAELCPVSATRRKKKRSSLNYHSKKPRRSLKTTEIKSSSEDAGHRDQVQSARKTRGTVEENKVTIGRKSVGQASVNRRRASSTNENQKETTRTESHIAKSIRTPKSTNNPGKDRRISFQEIERDEEPTAPLSNSMRWVGPSPNRLPWRVPDSPRFSVPSTPVNQETPRRGSSVRAATHRSIRETPIGLSPGSSKKRGAASTPHRNLKVIADARRSPSLAKDAASPCLTRDDVHNTLPGRSDSDCSLPAEPAQFVAPVQRVKKKRGQRKNPVKKRNAAKTKKNICGLQISESKIQKIINEDVSKQGPRRGTRTRIAPVKHWKSSEYVEYERRESGLVIKEVVRAKNSPILRPTKSQSKKKYKKAESSQSESDDFREEVNPAVLVRGDKNDLVQMNIMMTPAMLNLAPGNENGDMMFQKYCSQQLFSAGFLVLQPNAEKGLQFVQTDTLFFVILQGTVEVTVEETTTRLGKHCTVFIPSGNIYNIKNTHGSIEAKLHFLQFKG